MCFVPQWCTLLRHLIFQKCSDAGVLCTFYFGMCFTPQRRAIFDLSSGHVAPRPPLYQACFLIRNRKSLEKGCLATFPFFRASASFFFWFCLFPRSLWLFHLCFFHVSILSETWRLKFFRSIMATLPGIINTCENIFFANVVANVV